MDGDPGEPYPVTEERQRGIDGKQTHTHTFGQGVGLGMKAKVEDRSPAPCKVFDSIFNMKNSL